MHRVGRYVLVSVLLALLVGACAPAAPVSTPAPTKAPAAPTAAPAPTKAAAAPQQPAAPAQAAAKSAQKPDIPIEKMSIKVGMVPSTAYAPAYVAIERGYFKDRGLEVDIETTRSGDTAPLVATNQLSVAGVGFGAAFFNALASKMDLIIIGATSANHPKEDSSNQLVVRKELFDKGIVKSTKDLKGRKVAGVAKAGANDYFLTLALKAGGLTKQDVEVVLMPFPDMPAAFGTGVIDAALLTEPFVTQSEEKGLIVRLDKTSNQGEAVTGVMANTTFIKEHTNATTNFLIGWIKGARDLYGKGWNNPENAKIIEKHTKIAADIILKAPPPYFDPNGRVNQKSVEGLQKFILEEKYAKYPSLLPPSQIYDYTYLNKAIEFLGEFKEQ